MRLNRQQNKEAPARNGDPGDMWHALARLHAAHPEPVGLIAPVEWPTARLSIAKPEEIVLSARVDLFEGEPVRNLHDVLDTVTHDLAGVAGSASTLSCPTLRWPGGPARCGSGRCQPAMASRSSCTARSRWC